MSNAKISQALSLISTSKLNAALVQTGYGSEVSADKVHVVSVLTDIVNKGGISLQEIRDLVPLSTAVINAKQSPSTSSVTVNDSISLVNDALTEVRNSQTIVTSTNTLASRALDEARNLRSKVITQVDGIERDLLKRLDTEVSKITGVDYGKIDNTIQAEVGRLFKSLKKTTTPEQLQTIANSVAVFSTHKASEIFPAPLFYQQDGETVNFEDMEVLVWNDPEALTVLDDYVFNPANLHQALCALSESIPDNCWLAGERSTGKTAFTEQISARLKRKLFRINFDDSMERSEFIGGNILKNGDVEWKAGIIAQAIQHTGSLVLLDEIGFAKPSQLASLHALCERSANRAIVIPETGIRIPVASHVAFFCADNSNGHGDASGNFAGVRDQNTAFIDRFSYTLEFNYLPHADEVKLITNRTGLNADAADVLVTFANVAREKARAGVLTQPPSLRQLFAWARAVTKGVPTVTAFRSAVINKFPADCEPELVGIFTATVNTVEFKKFLTK
jgi:midasin (ATPase involved in ribosome maturation)